jgi:hypothetical protein
VITTDLDSCALLMRVVVTVAAIVKVLNKEVAANKDTELTTVFAIALLINLRAETTLVLVIEIFFNVLRTNVFVAVLVKLRILELVFKIVLVVVETADNSCSLILLASKEAVLVTVLDIVDILHMDQIDLFDFLLVLFDLK